MSELSTLENEVAQLIVDTLGFDDIAAVDIDPEAPLFREGLGLDSIDALELAMAISRQYGFQLRSDDSDNARIFSSLRALSAYVAEHKTQ